jgi:hypothetical protein
LKSGPRRFDACRANERSVVTAKISRVQKSWRPGRFAVRMQRPTAGYEFPETEFGSGRIRQSGAIIHQASVSRRSSEYSSNLCAGDHALVCLAEAVIQITITATHSVSCWVTTSRSERTADPQTLFRDASVRSRGLEAQIPAPHDEITHRILCSFCRDFRFGNFQTKGTVEKCSDVRNPSRPSRRASTTPSRSSNITPRISLYGRAPDFKNLCGSVVSMAAKAIVAPTATPNVIAVAIAMIRKSCRVQAFIAELSVGGPDARRDQTSGMPGAFQQGSRSAAIGGWRQLVHMREPTGNDLTNHRVPPYTARSAAFSTAVQHECSSNGSLVQLGYTFNELPVCLVQNSRLTIQNELQWCRPF